MPAARARARGRRRHVPLTAAEDARCHRLRRTLRELEGKDAYCVELIISNASNKPIYEQIENQIKGLILSGELEAGEQLPSIRALANSLRVSAITTKRAYEIGRAHV